MKTEKCENLKLLCANFLSVSTITMVLDEFTINVDMQSHGRFAGI